MEALGMVVLILGYLVSLVGGIIFLIAAFKESVLWGLGSMFVPFVSLVYLVKFWDDAKRGFFISLAALPLIIIGGALAPGMFGN